MTVMTMKEIVEFMETTISQSVPDTEDGLGERMNEINGAVESLVNASVLAKDIILKKLTEKDFAQFLDAVTKISVFVGMVNGDTNSAAMMMSLMSNGLQGYTHAVVLATIGALINEEVL